MSEFSNQQESADTSNEVKRESAPAPEQPQGGSQPPPPKQNGKRRPVSAPKGTAQRGNGRASQRRPQQGGQKGSPKGREEMDFGHIMRTVLLWAAMLLGVIVLVVIFN